MISTIEDLEFYQKLFTYIKVKGKEPLIEFFKALDDIKKQEIDDIITQLLFRKGPIADVLEKNRFIVSFLMGSDFSVLKSAVIKKKEIINMLELLTPKTLEISLNNLDVLENLGVKKVCLSTSPKWDGMMNNMMYVHEDGKGIKKTYSDVEITYCETESECYGVKTTNRCYATYGSDCVSYPSWIITTDNKVGEEADRIIYLRNFSFDTFKLPNLEELNSYHNDIKQKNVKLFHFPSIIPINK